MKKINVLIVIGTRPELIKMAPVVFALKSSAVFNVKVCLTGQHIEMLDQVLQDFDIDADFSLKVMSHNQSLSEVTSKIIMGVSDILKYGAFELILVHGDTTTAMAGGLAAFYNRVTLCHVEAGLRAPDVSAPFPEEFNRRMISLITDIYFSPTDISYSNLIKEGIDSKKIYVTGNTVIDSLLLIINKINNDLSIKIKIKSYFDKVLNFDLEEKRFILITAHRRENYGLGLDQICDAIFDLSNSFPDVYFVYPVHMNPNVKRVVFEKLSKKKNIKLIDAQPYTHFSYLLSKCYFVLTDSGGIQEEAPSLMKPVLLMRNETERPEAIDAGVVKLVTSNREHIFENCSKLLLDRVAYEKMATQKNPYGDGMASNKICNILEKIYRG